MYRENSDGSSLAFVVRVRDFVRMSRPFWRITRFLRRFSLTLHVHDVLRYDGYARPTNKAFDFTWTKLTTDLYRANIPTAAVLVARNAKVLQGPELRATSHPPLLELLRVLVSALSSDYLIFTLARSS